MTTDATHSGRHHPSPWATISESPLGCELSDDAVPRMTVFDVSVAPGVRVIGLEATAPFEIGDSGENLRRTRFDLRWLRIAVSAEAICETAAKLLSSAMPDWEFIARLQEGSLLVEARENVPLKSAAWCARFGAVAAPSGSITLIPWSSIGFGIDEVSVPERIAETTRIAAESFGRISGLNGAVTGENDSLSIDVVRATCATVFLPAGWKLPAGESLGPALVAVADHGIEVEFGVAPADLMDRYPNTFSTVFLPALAVSALREELRDAENSLFQHDYLQAQSAYFAGRRTHPHPFVDTRFYETLLASRTESARNQLDAEIRGRLQKSNNDIVALEFAARRAWLQGDAINVKSFTRALLDRLAATGRDDEMRFGRRAFERAFDSGSMSVGFVGSPAQPNTRSPSGVEFGTNTANRRFDKVDFNAPVDAVIEATVDEFTSADESIEALFDLARSGTDNGRTSDFALTCLKAANEIDSAHPTTLMWSGAAMVARGRGKKAIPVLEAAARKMEALGDRRSVDARLLAAEVYAYELKDIKRGYQQALAAADTDPYSFRTLHCLTALADAAGRNDEARRRIMDAIDYWRPKTAEGDIGALGHMFAFYELRAGMERRLGDVARAVKLRRDAIDIVISAPIDDHSPADGDRLAQIQAYRDRVTQARVSQNRDTLAAALEDLASRAFSSERAEALAELGVLRSEVFEDDAAALTALTEARRLDPEVAGRRPEVLATLESIYAARDDVGNLLRIYGDRIDTAQDGDLPNWLILRARLHQKSGDQRAAFEDVERLVTLDPTNIPGRRMRAEMHAADGNFSAAAIDYRAMLTSRNLESFERTEVQRALGLIEVRHLNDASSAIERLREVIKQVPGDQEVLEALTSIGQDSEDAAELVYLTLHELSLLLDTPGEIRSINNAIAIADSDLDEGTASAVARKLVLLARHHAAATDGAPRELEILEAARQLRPSSVDALEATADAARRHGDDETLALSLLVLAEELLDPDERATMMREAHAAALRSGDEDLIEAAGEAIDFDEQEVTAHTTAPHSLVTGDMSRPDLTGGGDDWEDFKDTDDLEIVGLPPTASYDAAFDDNAVLMHELDSLALESPSDAVAHIDQLLQDGRPGELRRALLVRKGRYLLDAGAEPRSALLALTGAMVIDPNSPETHFEMARTYLAQEDASRAGMSLRETLRCCDDGIEPMPPTWTEVAWAISLYGRLAGESNIGALLDHVARAHPLTAAALRELLDGM